MPMDNCHGIRQVFSSRINQILEKIPSKVRDNLTIVWLLAKNTLTVVLMALLILSPYLILPLLMDHPPPYCYVAYAIWIAMLIGSFILAAIVGYLRETKGLA